MEKTIEDYRIVENVDGFTIEVKSIIVNTFGRLWWKTTETKVVWNPLNDIGKITFSSFLNPPTKVEVYESLEDAKFAIEKFVKYPIYHYFTEKNECELDCKGCNNCFPKFPIDNPSQ